MNTRHSFTGGWRLAVAAGALAVLTVGCGSDVGAPANDIGNRAPAVEPDVVEAEVPDAPNVSKCAKWPSEARAEHRTLCR